MEDVKVIDVIRVTANPMILGDQDRLVITLVYKGEEHRVAMADQVLTPTSFKVLLKNALSKTKRRTTENLTELWKGEYKV